MPTGSPLKETFPYPKIFVTDLFAVIDLLPGRSRLVYKKYPSGSSGIVMFLIFPEGEGQRTRAA